MLEKIKITIQNNKIIIENYFFMTVLQVLNSLFYLLIYPFLIRTLGTESYGLYVFAMSIITYFIIFVSFGFDMPAAKEIAQHQAYKDTKTKILSCIFTAKIYLEIISAVIFATLIISLPMLRQYWCLYSICFANTITGIFFPTWYYQGIQRMRIVTYIQLTLKILSLPFIFLMIKTSKDVELFALITTSTNVIGAIISTIIIKYYDNIQIYFVRLSDIRIWYKNAMPFFWSSAAGAIKEQSITVIIGTFFGMKDVAIYDLANKIIIIPRTLVMNINGALFPKLATNMQISTVKRIISLESFIGLAIICCIALLGKWVVLFMGGIEMQLAYPMALILSVSILTWLVVGAYISFIFVPNNLYYLVTHNQIIAFISFFIFCSIGLLIEHNIMVLAIAIALSGLSEITFCKYSISKNKLLWIQ